MTAFLYQRSLIIQAVACAKKRAYQHGKPSTNQARPGGSVSVQGFREDGLAMLLLLEVVGEPQHLEAAGITHDPEIQLVAFSVGGRDLHEASEARLLLDGAIDARTPATRAGKERGARSRALPVRDLRGVE